MRLLQGEAPRVQSSHTPFVETQLTVEHPDLLQYDEVWAAAGTWNDVFGIEPRKLVEASGGSRY
ncbi:MAG: hypothetical protein ACKO84_06935 [Actinomycetota bacterium]